MRLSKNYSVLEDTGSSVVASAPLFKRITPSFKMHTCHWAGASRIEGTDGNVDRIEQLRCVYSQGKYAVNIQAVSAKIIDYCLNPTII